MATVFNKKLISIFLCLFIILGAFFSTYEQAHAVVLVDDAVILTIATIIVGCGILAYNEAELKVICTEFWEFCPPTIQDVLKSLTKTLNSQGQTSFKIPSAVLGVVSSFITKFFKADATGSGGDLVVGGSGSNLIFDGIDLSFLPFFSGTPDIYSDAVRSKLMQVDDLKKFMVLNTEKNNYILQLPYFVSIPSSTYTKPYIWLSTSSGSPWNLAWQFYYEDKATGSPCSPTCSTYGLSLGLCNYDGYYRLIYTEGRDTYTKAIESAPTIDSGVTAKADGTYFPQTGTKALTTDIPLTYPQSMSKLLEGGISGVRTDVQATNGILSNLFELVKGIPGAIATAISALFIPPNFSWTDFLSETMEPLGKPQNLDLKSYISYIEIPDVTGTMNGKNVTFVNNSPIRNNIEKIRGLIGAFMVLLLGLFNYNMFCRLLGYTGFTINSGRDKGEK